MQYHEQILPEKRNDGEHGPRMYRRIEGEAEPLLVQSQEVFPEEQMPRAGDRQKLCKPLHYAQKYCFYEFQYAPHPPFSSQIQSHYYTPAAVIFWPRLGYPANANWQNRNSFLMAKPG